MKFACGIVLLVVIYTTTARFVPFEDVRDVETEDFVKAGERFLELLQKKISEQDARFKKIEEILNTTTLSYGSKLNPGLVKISRQEINS
ncbi:Hypothetical predicted protein [Paramuricea clavata]|uniref:Uncharacterized protein n=1 Tax=Paramuricea clavata TaxID=317549 RepID=A0A6S7H0S8_PARCT|nr:Hypothetical predicted protein [Paramuricea clavata]